MKTREVIKLLQEADPDGESECCIGNCGIIRIERLPAYYDGSLQQLVLDADGRPLSGTRVREGHKVSLVYRSISDCLLNDPEFTVTYQSERDRLSYEAHDQEIRRAGLRVDYEVERQEFADWVFLTIQSQRKVPFAWVERIKQAAFEFFEREYCAPADIQGQWGKSHLDCLVEYWTETVSVRWTNYSQIVIERRNGGSKDAESS